MNNSRSLASAFIIILSMAVLAGLVWANYRFSQYHLGGEGFSIQWISIQALARDGSDPYSNEVTAQIQTQVPREDAFVEDIYPKYTSPLYSGVVIFPFTLIGDKALAQAVWMTAQLMGIFVMILLSVRLSGWKPAWYTFALFSLFAIFGYHALMPWLNGGLSVWAAFFLVLALVSMSSNRNEMGGVFLALSAIQPQMVILPVIFILVWSISRRRTVLVVWFLITLILLSVIGLFLVPNWIIDYIRLLYNFAGNFPPGTPGIFFMGKWPGLGKQLSWLVSGLTILVMLIEWIIALKRDFRWLLWTVCLIMVLSQWIGIPTAPGNFIELVLPLVLVAAMLTERWPRGGQVAAVFITLVIFAWEWFLFYENITGNQPSLQINMIFPLPFILIIGLYWVRWWAIRPRRLLIEEIRLSETY